MVVLTVAELKQQINFTDDLGTDDDALLTRKIAAAQDHIERLLGFTMAERYPLTVPPALVEAVAQLAADWYENREASLVGVGVTPMPFGVEAIVAEYREYSFG